MIIVIIGITIAFTLNKWAESNKDRNSRKQYLESLLLDLESEKAHLEGNIEQFRSKIRDIQQIFPYLAGKQDGRDSISYKIFNLAQIVQFQPHDITYKTLLNSGDLGLFDDFDFKKSMELHYSNHQEIQLDYERQNSINDKYFGDFMIHHIDFQQLRLGNYDFIDDPLLRNIIQSLYGTFEIAA